MSAAPTLQTEFAFTLPRGYLDEHGQVHRDGLMRLATARDEVEPLGDSRVRANEAYLGVLLLSRVITRLGGIAPVTPATIERLFSSDFAFVQDLYLRLNGGEAEVVETQCPACATRFALSLAGE